MAIFSNGKAALCYKSVRFHASAPETAYVFILLIVKRAFAQNFTSENMKYNYYTVLFTVTIFRIITNVSFNSFRTSNFTFEN